MNLKMNINKQNLHKYYHYYKRRLTAAFFPHLAYLYPCWLLLPFSLFWAYEKALLLSLFLFQCFSDLMALITCQGAISCCWGAPLICARWHDMHLRSSWLLLLWFFLWHILAWCVMAPWGVSYLSHQWSLWVTVMSSGGCWRSQWLGDPNYRPRTTWSLPVVLSVGVSTGSHLVWSLKNEHQH